MATVSAREASRAYAARHPDRRKASRAKWVAANKQALKERATLARVFKYGLTPESYSSLLASQGGRCEICAEPFRATPHIDHCHIAGGVRGLLCAQCNTGLGKFKDSPELLRAAINYLKVNLL